MAPFLEGYLASLDVLAHDPGHAPRQADRHPRRHHALDGAGRHHPLALAAHEVAHEREAVAALTEDLADEGQGRTRVQAAAGSDDVAVAHAGGGVLDARELLAG